MYKLGWFSTGRGDGSMTLLNRTLDAIKSGRLPAEISFVFCNREHGEGDGSDRFLQAVKDYKIPLISLSHRRFRRKLGPSDDWRKQYFNEVAELLAPYQFDLGVHAGLLLITSAEWCTSKTLINLHPAAPGGPKGTWQEVIWELIASNAHESGCHMHHVTPELDAGPVVTYSKFSIDSADMKDMWEETRGKSVEELKKSPGEELPLFKTIRQKGVAHEVPLVIETLRSFANGEVAIKNGLVVDSTGRQIHGYALTAQIEAHLKAAQKA